MRTPCGSLPCTGWGIRDVSDIPWGGNLCLEGTARERKPLREQPGGWERRALGKASRVFPPVEFGLCLQEPLRDLFAAGDVDLRQLSRSLHAQHHPPEDVVQGHAVPAQIFPAASFQVLQTSTVTVATSPGIYAPPRLFRSGVVRFSW